MASEISRPIFVAGEWVRGDQQLTVTNPANGEVVDVTSVAGPDDSERAVAAGLAAQRLVLGPRPDVAGLVLCGTRGGPAFIGRRSRATSARQSCGGSRRASWRALT